VATLVAIEARGRAFVDELLAAWDRGDAVLPVDPRLPRPLADRLVATLRAGGPAAPDVALVVPTSGTTGEPKGVELTHGQVAASARATSAFLDLDPARHRWLACLPLAHVGGLSVVTRAHHTGTSLVVHDGFDAAAVDAAARDEGCTHVSLVATAMARIDTSRWERIVIGGSAAPADRPPNSVSTYGLTETGSGVVYDGTPLPGVEVRIDDGEILLRGPMVATSYRDGTPVVDADGWLHTGDLGRFEGGVLEVFGRRDDVIISGGENVDPEPVERRLRDHPAISDVAVVGRPDPEWGHRVVAVVELEPDAELPPLDELRAWVRAELPVWAAPKEVVVRHLPRTAIGKIRRRAVADGLSDR
jgi:O-succinylbenzoic acid--CoA ligase